MAMQGGSVIVNDDESVSGGGLARAIFNHLATLHAAELSGINTDYNTMLAEINAGQHGATTEEIKQTMRPSFDATAQAAARLRLLRKWATTANDIGPPLVAYIQAEASIPLANVKATVSTSTSTGRTPNPNDPDTAIQGPASAVDLPVTGSGGASSLRIE
jgi:hypothetical protein